MSIHKFAVQLTGSLSTAVQRLGQFQNCENPKPQSTPPQSIELCQCISTHTQMWKSYALTTLETHSLEVSADDFISQAIRISTTITPSSRLTRKDVSTASRQILQRGRATNRHKTSCHPLGLAPHCRVAPKLYRHQKTHKILHTNRTILCFGFL